ncbi:hypothetical protein MA9V1_263 [Chryseobacterium phage MA9V-1]|nr:hypothetical protein MA9V1_263 [Chryseobacterium phage MA9V-1]
MPQIFDEHFDDTIADLERLYGVDVVTLPLAKLLPTQCEVNVDKIKAKMTDIDCSSLKFICSDDFHIADGHHSHVAGLLVEPDAEVKVYKVNVETRKLITALNRMKHTVSHNINESNV